jgi:LysR family nitrogen assimilation transcriptional regulator
MQTVLIFDDFRAFVAVAQCGSISQAAAALCIAQPALSKRIQRLEQRIGTVLMERHARGVVLTQPGHLLFARTQRIVNEVSDIERNLSSFALQATEIHRTEVAPLTQ